MFNQYDMMWVFCKSEAKTIYRCINVLTKTNGRRMISYDSVVGYILLSLIQKHYGLAKDNPVCFYIDALRVDIGFSEYTGKYILSVYEDEEYAARCRASA